MAEYESDITRFLRELKQRKPDLERKQAQARAIWWDKALDYDEQARFKRSTLRSPAYVYMTKPKLPPQPMGGGQGKAPGEGDPALASPGSAV